MVRRCCTLGDLNITTCRRAAAAVSGPRSTVAATGLGGTAFGPKLAAATAVPGGGSAAAAAARCDAPVLPSCGRSFLPAHAPVPLRFSPMRHATLPVIHTFRCVPCQLLALHVALLHPCFVAFSAFARFPSRFGGESMLQASSCFTRL